LKRARTLKNRFRFDWTFIFCFLVMALAPVSSVFWFFIPVGVSLSLESPKWLGRSVCIVSFIATITSPIWWVRSLTSFDLLGICVFYLLGVFLWSLKNAKQGFLPYLLWPLISSFFAALGLSLAVGLQTPGFNFGTWSLQQMGSDIFPYFFHGSRYPEEHRYIFDTFAAPILRPAIIGWFAALMAMAFLVNALMENLLKSFRVANLRGQARVFDRFNQWKAHEFVLVPIVLALIVIAVDYMGFKGGNFPLQVLGWNLLVLSLFPVFVQGIALLSFLIPRVNFLILILIFGLLFLNPIPVLVLAGLGDLWFDLRSKVNPERKDR